MDKTKRYDGICYGVTGKLKRLSYYQDDDSGQIYRSARVATMGATVKINLTAEQYAAHEKDVGSVVTCVGEQELDAKTDRVKFLYGAINVVK